LDPPFGRGIIAAEGGSPANAAAEVRLRADPIEILSLSEALTALEATDAQAATIVKMRFVLADRRR
jgi:hypothetical protein